MGCTGIGLYGYSLPLLLVPHPLYWYRGGAVLIHPTYTSTPHPVYQYTPLYLYRGWLSSIIGYQYRVRAYQYADVYQYRGGRTSIGVHAPKGFSPSTCQCTDTSP